MAVLRFDPFRDGDRLTDQARGRSRLAGLPMDIVRRGDELVVQVDLPGVDPASVDVTVEKDVLSITAERPHDRRDGDDVIVRERPTGRFTRRLRLGDGVDVERVAATVDAGVLTVTFPTAEEVRPRRIEIGSAAATSESRAHVPAGAPADSAAA